MITIEYKEEGEAMSDFRCDKYIKNLKDLELLDREYSTSSSIVILAIRAAIARGELDHTKIQFKFNGHILHPNKNGRMKYWPKGFCDIDIDFMDDILSSCKYG